MYIQIIFAALGDWQIKNIMACFASEPIYLNYYPDYLVLLSSRQLQITGYKKEFIGCMGLFATRSQMCMSSYPLSYNLQILNTE